MGPRKQDVGAGPWAQGAGGQHQDAHVLSVGLCPPQKGVEVHVPHPLNVTLLGNKDFAGDRVKGHQRRP